MLEQYIQFFGGLFLEHVLLIYGKTSLGNLSAIRCTCVPPINGLILFLSCEMRCFHTRRECRAAHDLRADNETCHT